MRDWIQNVNIASNYTTIRIIKKITRQSKVISFPAMCLEALYIVNSILFV